MPRQFKLKVNRKSHTVSVEPETPLLYVLRDNLKLHGPKFGCGLGQCGSCNVIIGGEAVRSCSMTVSQVKGREITTLEGIGTAGKPHPLQKAFIGEQAVQCGYCIGGMIIAGKALLDRNPHPTDAEIRQALDGNVCRCGTHLRILRAIRRASREMA
jgi:nicotinate dehydrogenase subunit A